MVHGSPLRSTVLGRNVLDSAPRFSIPFELSGGSLAIRRFVVQLETASRSLDPLLISGETGVGKSLAVEALHGLCDERATWRSIGADGFDERLCSRLAGDRRAPGFAVLVIDETGDLSGAAQRRLLRLLVARDGPRIIGTTSRDLSACVLRGTFLRGLLDRLGGHEVRVPPLRERREDLPVLVERILGELVSRYRRPVRGVAPEALERLVAHAWEGNLRELRHELARALLLTAPGDEIRAAALSPELRRSATHGRFTSSLRQRARDIERSMLARVLERHGWNVSAAARELKISRVGLSKKLRVLDMKRPAVAALAAAAPC
ncbi:MAG TPA: helix-turn-helix domain-containing protein [Thermoanaerobaculia bacterium]|nr:helix-turn-helix domain-containing protein [Thermoanaerobaculia bacterium]